MKTKLLGLVLLAGIAFSSCKKDSVDNNKGDKSIDELSAPAGFSWTGSRDVRLSIGITDARFQNQIHVIKVYSGDPAKGGDLLSKGSATLITPFNTKFILASTTKQVYIEKIAPNGDVISKSISLINDNVSVSFSESGAVQTLASAGGRISSTSTEIMNLLLQTSPDCNTGCTTTITSSNSFNMSNNEVYCVTSNNQTVNVQNSNGGTLRICATGVTVNGLKIRANIKVIVAAGASVTFNNFAWEGPGVLQNFGTITMQSNFKVDQNGDFLNKGNFTASSEFIVMSNTNVANTGSISTGKFEAEGDFNNSGTINISQGSATLKNNSNFTNTGNLNFNGSGANIEGTFKNSGNVNFADGEIRINGNNPVITNSGNITGSNSKLTTAGIINNTGIITFKELQHNSANSEINNNCTFYITTNAVVDKPINNYKYFRVTGNLQLNGSGRINLFNGAIFRSGSLNTLDGFIVGSGSTSVYKLDGNLDGNRINDVNNVANSGNPFSNAKFSGSVDLATSLNIPNGMFVAPAKRETATKAYIAEGGCMAEGNGTPPVVNNPDSDGDGVPNAQDDYPNDPDMAYNNPMDNYDAGGSTVAFEDSWPLKGDYDLNDVVINYKYIVVTNKDNKVVKVLADYTLLATGGNFQNGAGIEFPVAASSLVSGSFSAPEGVTLESGQDKIVVILFTNSRAKQATWNTETGQSVSPSVPFSISFRISNGPTLEEFGIGNYNPFIYNNSPGFGRGYETHLYGKTPTNKAATALFGTGDDASGGSKYYGTANNLPWAIEVPIANFKYPVERAPITDGYKMFADWAINGGTSSQDWYSNTSGTYRDASKLYGSN